MSLEAAPSASIADGVGSRRIFLCPPSPGCAPSIVCPFVNWCRPSAGLVAFTRENCVGAIPAFWRILRSVQKPKELLADAEALLAEIIRDDLLTARGVYGFFPASSVGDDIELYRDLDRQERDRLPRTPAADGRSSAGSVQPGFGRPMSSKESGRTDLCGRSFVEQQASV